MDKVDDKQLEALGEALMIYMYPNTRQQKFMVQMMGGKSSEMLASMHKLMGYNYLKDDYRKMLGYTMPMMKKIMQQEVGESRNYKEFSFVQPFLVHMGIPEPPGGAKLRLAIVNTSLDDNRYDDVALHLETGVLDRFGALIRSNGIKNEEYFEFMMQYAFIYFDNFKMNGMSLFGQLDFPTSDSTEDEDAKWILGLSVRLTSSDILDWNANIHYDTKKNISRYESSFILKIGSNLFPVLEFRGHLNDRNDNYLMGGVKFRVVEKSAFGIGLETSYGERSASRTHIQKTFLTYETIY